MSPFRSFHPAGDGQRLTKKRLDLGHVLGSGALLHEEIAELMEGSGHGGVVIALAATPDGQGSAQAGFRTLQAPHRSSSWVIVSSVASIPAP